MKTTGTPLVPERLWAQMTEGEQQLVRETVRGQRRSSRMVICPHCEKELRVWVELRAALPDADEPAPGFETSMRFTPAEQKFLEAASAVGLLKAFEAAVHEERPGDSIPKDMQKFFLTFWKLIAPVSVPPVARACWQVEFNGPIETYGSNGIIAILCGGVLKAFVPNRYLHTVRLPHAGPGRRPAIPTTELLERWVKGRFGYVPAEAGSFGAAMRQRNKGEFGRLVQ